MGLALVGENGGTPCGETPCGGTPSVSAGGAASSLREGALGFCSAASPSRVAPAKRGAGRFVNGQTPAQSKIAWEVIPAPPIIQARPRRNKLHYVNPALRAGFTPFRLFLLSPPQPLRWVAAGAPCSPRTSFSLFHRARRILSFSSWKKKREWGAQMHQPSSWLNPSLRSYKL